MKSQDAAQGVIWLKPKITKCGPFGVGE